MKKIMNKIYFNEIKKEKKKEKKNTRMKKRHNFKNINVAIVSLHSFKLRFFLKGREDIYGGIRYIWR